MNEKRYSNSGTMGFTPEDVAAGRLEDFIKVLMKMEAEMRIWYDGYCWSVDYVERCIAQNGVRYELPFVKDYIYTQVEKLLV